MEIYVAYLSALHRASQSLRAGSLGDHPEDVPRNLATRADMRHAGLVETREHLVPNAAKGVVRVSAKRAGEGQGACARQMTVLDKLASRRQTWKCAIMREDLGVTVGA
ncbi:hypothetical protein ACWC2K_04060 [Streptomyces chattanoogensis]